MTSAEFPQKLVGEQMGMLRDALVESFPGPGELAQVVRVRLDESLAAIVPTGAGVREVAFKLVEWANAQGRIEGLVRGAVAENPGNRRLRAFVLTLGHLVDERGKLTQETLSTLYARRKLAVAPEDVRALDEEITRARKQRRTGHHFKEGEHLGDDGRYQLLRELGRGGFATVWEAWDRSLKRHVAVKVLHGHLNADEVRLSRFESGARKMLRLEHPSIVRVLAESQQWADFRYFVMRYVEGGDLRGAVLAKKIDGAAGVGILAKVGKALTYAHAQGITHGDVKPANVLLTASLEPQLTDFDLAQGGDSTTHTVRGGAMGSALYTAPEVLHDARAVDARADVFSLGCTALFVLLGREFKVQEWSQPAKALARLGCEEHVKRAVVRAMELDPEERFATVREFVEALTSPLLAEGVRDAEVGVTQAAAKADVREFDVFLAYNSADAASVASMDQALRRRGISPWVDHEQLPLGSWWMNVLQRTSVAIVLVLGPSVLGPSGLGPWQAVELRAFVQQRVERGVPVIPVLLPGVKSIPAALPFLSGLELVQFVATLDERATLDRLVWGITGKRPERLEKDER